MWINGNRVERTWRATSRPTAEDAERYERLLEAVRIAEESAMSELAAFGCIEPPEMHNLAEWSGVLRKNALAESFAGHFGTHEEYAE